MNPFPFITAHTGCMAEPDNSIRSGQAGLANGADIVEDDILVTKDGVLVLSHDDEIVLADGTKAKISNMTLSEWQGAARTPADKLEELLSIVVAAGARMNLDMKSDEALYPLGDLLGRLNAADSVFLTGCGYSRAILAGTVLPGIRKLLNINAGSFLSLPYDDAVKEACREAQDSGCFGLNVPYLLFNERMMEIAGDAGLPVYVWTVGETEQMQRCAELGAASITTRAVSLLSEVKANWIAGNSPNGN